MTKTDVSMNSIVGMWALVVDDQKTVRRQLFIAGRVEDQIYLVQALEAFSGYPSVGKLFHISEMKDWVILPTKEIAEDVLADYSKNKIFRYGHAK